MTFHRDGGPARVVRLANVQQATIKPVITGAVAPGIRAELAGVGVDAPER